MYTETQSTHCVGHGAPFSGDRWECKDGVHSLPEVWLVVFDQHHIAPMRLCEPLGHLPLGQDGIHRDDVPLQHQGAQQVSDLWNLIGRIRHGMLSQGEAQAVGQR
jgi:hypothetical protein